MDQIDYQIIELLRENSRISYKEIGNIIHLTGQAVGIRINKLIEKGIIENFTIKVNKEKIGISVTALIKIYMKKLEYRKMLQIIEDTASIVEAYKTSADCCYFLKVEASDNEELNRILDRINEFANYQLTLSIGKIK